VLLIHKVRFAVATLSMTRKKPTIPLLVITSVPSFENGGEIIWP